MRSSVERPKIGVIYASRLALPAEAIRKEVSSELEARYRTFIQKIENVLKRFFPEVEFIYEYVSSSSDSMNVIRRTKDVVGYIVFAFEHPTGYLRTIMRSGKPTIVIAYTYVGAGELLQSYPKAVEEGYPVIGVTVRDVTNSDRIRKYVNYLLTIHRLKSSNILLIVSPVTKQYLDVGYPLAVDVYGMMSDVNRTFGINVSAMSINQFKKIYYETVSEDEARRIAEKWFNEAETVIAHSKEELVKPAKLYLAFKKLIEDLKLDAIAIDCITLYHAGFLDTWPCLAFMELTKEGIICGCEADLYSTVVMLLMKYLANVPGFINDPSPDMDKNEIIYYHCYAPINLLGFETKRLLPYIITPAHWGTKKLSINVSFPVGVTMTSVGIDARNKIISVHTAKILGNEKGPEECSTKVVGKVSTKTILEKWNPEAGWHRVLFYGDYREDIKAIAKLLGLKTVEEDT